MNTVVLHLLVLAAVMDLPAVELETLKGERHKGQFAELTDAAAVLQTGESRIEVPLAQVLEIRFSPPAAPAEPLPADGAQVFLTDGGRVSCSGFSIAGGKAQLQSILFGAWTIPAVSLTHVRFGGPNSRLDEAWAGLLQRESKKDMLVIRKGEVLDQLSGVIGDVGEKVNFLLDGDEIPVGREKVFGLIYARRAAAASKATCQIALQGGDILQATRLKWDGSSLQAKLSAGQEVRLPIEKLESLDFSTGKLRYLSQLEPREVKYVPYFDFVLPYRRDRSLDGGPLRLKGTNYSRGVALHSRTFLRYRIAGEYGRFQAVMGIDQEVESAGGHVHVVISGDGKPLHESDVRVADAPKPLDLDVTGVRDLEILVDFAGNLSIGDHLDLADAKLIK